MNIQARKLQVMKMILETENAQVLESIRKLLANDVGSDFWNTLTNEQKHEIEQGISEIENGETVDYENIMGRHRK
ncbi:MAG: hypothetical protein ACOC2E_05970 [Bacteroidota bacterium]